MMTLTESTTAATSLPMNYNNYTVERPYPAVTYDYRPHHNPWEKFNYSAFPHSQQQYGTTFFPTHSMTGDFSSTIKSHFDTTTPNLNNTNPNFYRRHTESNLPTSSTSIYSSSSSTNLDPTPTCPFNYSSHPTTVHHHNPSGLFFGWNNGSSLVRTHSASYQDYSGANRFPSYHHHHPVYSSIEEKTSIAGLSSVSQMESATRNSYTPFFNGIPPFNFTLPPPPMPPPQSTSRRRGPSKRSAPSGTNSVSTKRQRLTTHLRSEILKLKANKPTVFAWEIQQTLLQNGICTAQSLPSATMIQRVLNEPYKPVLSAAMVEMVDTKPNVDQLLQSLLNRINPISASASSSSCQQSSPVTICLSPSPSPSLSTAGESTSECSICLESYRSGQEVSILACSHEYHSSCIGGWMKKNRSCPMCRKDIHNQPQFVTLLI